MAAENINPTRELTLLLILSALWGASFTFIRVGVETIPPITFIACRTLIAGAILCAILYARGLKLPRDAAMWRRFLIQTCLNSVVPFTLIAWAERSVPAGLAVILNSTTPIFAFLLTAAVTRHEPVSAGKLVGVAAGLFGVCLIVGAQSLGGFGETLSGEFAILVASICYAGAAIVGKTFKALDPMLPAAGSFICGAVILVPISLIIDRSWALQPSASSLYALLALSVFSTALAFVIYFRLLRTLGSVGATAQAYLRVPIGVAVGAIFLGETLAPTAWIGLGCVIAGVAAMTLPERKLVRAE